MTCASSPSAADATAATRRRNSMPIEAIETWRNGPRGRPCPCHVRSSRFGHERQAQPHAAADIQERPSSVGWLRGVDSSSRPAGQQAAAYHGLVNRIGCQLSARELPGHDAAVDVAIRRRAYESGECIVLGGSAQKERTSFHRQGRRAHRQRRPRRSESRRRAQSGSRSGRSRSSTGETSPSAARRPPGSPGESARAPRRDSRCWRRGTSSDDSAERPYPPQCTPADEIRTREGIR